MQMMNKNGFSRCAEFYIGRLRKEGRHSTAHVYKNAIFSLANFVARPMCRSDRSPASVYDVTGSIFMSVA